LTIFGLSGAIPDLSALMGIPLIAAVHANLICFNR